MCTDQVYYAGEQIWLSLIHLTCPTSERVCPWPSLPSLGDTWRTAPRWEPVSGCNVRMEMWQSGHFNYDSGISHQLTQEGVFLPSPSAWSSWCLPASPRGQPHGTSSGAEIRREGNIFHILLKVASDEFKEFPSKIHWKYDKNTSNFHCIFIVLSSYIN